jgi:hypothetical protein
MQRYNGLNPDVTVVINASPYETGKQEKRLHKAAQCPTPVVYVNRVGGQDGLVFDGRSFVYDNGTRVVLPLAEESGCTIALSPASPTKMVKAISEEEEIYTILKRGLRDYVDAVKPRKVLLGLSGQFGRCRFCGQCFGYRAAQHSPFCGDGCFGRCAGSSRWHNP